MCAWLCSPAGQQAGQRSGGTGGGGGRGNFRVDESAAAGAPPNRGDFTLEEAIRSRRGSSGDRALTSPGRDEVSDLH